jgi:hypothetical protein
MRQWLADTLVKLHFQPIVSMLPKGPGSLAARRLEHPMLEGAMRLV